MTHLNDLGEPHAPVPSPDPNNPVGASEFDEPSNPTGPGASPDSRLFPGSPLSSGPVDGWQEVRDRLDLRRLVDTYASALDRRSTELFASLFDEDGELVLNRPSGTGRPPRVFDGRDGWASALSVLESCVVTTHFVGNHTVRLAGDSATGETYCLAHEIRPAEAVHRLRVRSIRYQDSYRRTAGRWRFARRILTVDWTEDRVLVSPSAG
ncbi:nuclear transport factor 2 family protein [Streptomyces europaeiscabiei]|uniref:nuclear transport factor 2 family protein n=1 Tax=Streptomyces europaeiscabiei TaxID=146819 RepID=UPI0029AC97FB|nr:nuclear transport factor 2 family protein [Streptomyces europaeiscabiei]MDX3613222.1 nuclear transport factor 2 family protein [Streptomyces europaeiscabiei]